MVAVKLLMKDNTLHSNNPKDIKGIGIAVNKSSNIYAVEDLYNYLKENPDIKILVKNTDSYLIPVRATNGEVYIRSFPNKKMIDSLMNLPRI